MERARHWPAGKPAESIHAPSGVLAASVPGLVDHRGEITWKAEIRSMARGILVVAVLTMLSACGGGDSGAPPPPTQTVGGTVSGDRLRFGNSICRR